MSENNPPKRPTAKCPECGVSMRADRLDRHIARVHRAREKLPPLKVPEKIEKAELSSYEKRKASVKTTKSIKSLKRRCPRCLSKFTWEEWSAHKQQCDNKPFIGANEAYKRTSSNQKSTLGAANTDSGTWESANQGRVCPFCQEKLNYGEWREHVQKCSYEQRKKSREQAKVDLSNKFTTSLQQKKYISDQHGIVQDYKTWIENQSIGESDPDKRWKEDVPLPKVSKARRKTKRINVSRTKSFITCPECRARLKSSNLGRHMNKVHCK
jgi:hypothetical protein